MAWRRQRSVLFAPASASFRIPMICSSVNRFRFIAGPPRGHPSRRDSHHAWSSFRGAGRSDYSADGQVLVERIDDTTVDLVLDPAVYIVNSGKHTISFACNDFRKEKKSEEQLAVMMRPGHYYQVIPIRRVRVEDMRFELAEITKDKSQSIGGENSRV